MKEEQAATSPARKFKALAKSPNAMKMKKSNAISGSFLAKAGWGVLSQHVNSGASGSAAVELVKTTKRASWKLDWFPGTYTGQLVSQILIATAMVGVSTVVWGLLGGDRVLGGDEASDQVVEEREGLGGDQVVEDREGSVNWSEASWHAWSLFVSSLESDQDQKLVLVTLTNSFFFP